MTNRGLLRIDRIIIWVLLIGFILYGLFEAYKLIVGPRIDILSPQNGATVDTSTVLIEGKIRNASFITLNDRRVFVDDQGMLREKLLLPEGYTIIKVTAEDRFKKRVEEKLALWRPHGESSGQLFEELKNTSTSTATSTSSTTATTTNGSN